MIMRGFDKALKALTGAQKQTKFATAKALNATAKDIQQFTTGKLLPEKFTLRARGTPWYKPGTRYGFNIRFASKTRLIAVIGSRADWLRLHEQGGEKTARSGRLVIPSVQWKAKSEILARRKRPRQIMHRRVSGFGGKPFILRGRAGGIYVRQGKARGPLVRLFAFESSVRIRPVLDFHARGMALARRNFAAHFARELRKAIATAR